MAIGGFIKSVVVLDCVLLLVFTLSLGAEGRKCPRNVLKEAKRCMRRMNSIHQRHDSLLTVLMPGSSYGTKQLCRNGKIQDAFACLNRLYSSCARSKVGMKHLEMMVGIGRWRNAIDNICESLKYLENDSDCETKTAKELTPCAKRAKDEFDRDMSFLQADLASLRDAGQVEGDKAKVDIGCSFTSKIIVCLEETSDKYCPYQVSLLRKKAFQDFIPPACAKRAKQRSVATHPKYTTETERPKIDKPRVQDKHHDNKPGVVEVVNLNHDGNSNNNNKNDHTYEIHQNNDDVNGRRTNRPKSKTSYDEEYIDVKLPREGVVGAARSAPEASGSSAESKNYENGSSSALGTGSLFLVTILVLMQKLL